MKTNLSAQAILAEVISETDAKWEKSRHLYPFGAAGFQVAFSPVSTGGLVCIGMNPGGTEKDFDRVAAATYPKSHDWFEWDYPLARKMRDSFRSIAAEKQLEASTCLNLRFFRSQSMREWQTADRSVRRDLETFSVVRVRSYSRRWLRKPFWRSEWTPTTGSAL